MTVNYIVDLSCQFTSPCLPVRLLGCGTKSREKEDVTVTVPVAVEVEGRTYVDSWDGTIASTFIS